MYGARGGALTQSCVTFLPRAAIELGVPERLRLTRRIEQVEYCRTVEKRDMMRNDRMPRIDVDPETHRVMVDGEHAFIEPAETLPLNHLYYLL
jgi:urease subunit alpha